MTQMNNNKTINDLNTIYNNSKNSDADNFVGIKYSDDGINILFPIGYHGAPIVGGAALLPPLFLGSELMFQFYDQGMMRLIVKNFSEYGFEDWAYGSKRLHNTITPESILSGKELENYANIRNNVQGWIFGRKYSVPEIDAQLKIAHKLLDGGYYIFGTPKTVLAAYRERVYEQDYYNNKYLPIWVDKFEQLIAEEKLVWVSDYLWEEGIRPLYEYMFYLINEELGSKIQGIAEDGELTWELVDDKLLPVDKKRRKSFRQAGLDFYTYWAE